ncbi:GNAT family N-acetyltransferase [Paenibacillus sp. GCM10027627]|uniref:GNAT family N-acetyltransferase n=1 Tax=unclassified Paenibacillus TaxID=185978 RepID=UPI00363EE4E6
MIEQATPQDVNEVMPLLLSAIGSIAHTLSGSVDDEETWRVLSGYYAEQGNRLSYRNVLVDRREGAIAGMLICYSGDEAEGLDRPIRDRLTALYGEDTANQLVPECKPGDFYLDSVAVDERFQGRGIAKELIAAFESRGRAGGFAKLSLIVEEYNDKARSIYTKLGFEEDGLLQISGGTYTRMVKNLL